MKILFLTNIPSPYRVDFFNELGKLCELTVVYERRNATDRDVNWERKTAIEYKEIYLSGIKFGTDSAICLGIIEHLIRNDYDIIIIGVYSSPTAMMAIKYLSSNNIPFLINSDGGFIKKDRKIKYLVKKYFISKASYWLSTARITDDYLTYYGTIKDRIYRYPFTSVRKDEIIEEIITFEEKLELREKLNIPEKQVVVTVGQFIYRKGFDVLLEASKYLNNNIGIYIIGGEPTKEYFSKKEEYKLINVHFVGFKKKEELKEYYKAADLFVLPTREDIWGLVINEAMAYGLPVITTDKCIAGLELIKDYENGFIIPVSNEKVLSEKIELILSDKNMQINISKNNISKIKNYSIEAMARRHLEIFKEIIN